ncbi:SDR family oxidoreductase [Nocardioides sp.]|uniref:SDR family NAD(P)-dependent oxidoreductase n=1 Tax=Nocardioides sp. TaxID=35761 RepID=UPI002B26E9DC|nr:SDR family oxidoreductase [Nocardioides sp.]
MRRPLTFLRGSAIPEQAVVVVTGASSGIGRAVAIQLAEEGHHLALVARCIENLEECAAACRDAGCASVMVVPTDVSDDQAVAELFAKVVAEHGRVDGVAHCAGEVTYGRVEDTSAEVFDRVLASNLSGSANVARHAVAQMREAERGVLVIVGSLLGHIAVPEMTPYVVSKWGLRALARQLALENLDVRDLHVCHVAPGSVDTPIYDKAIDSGGTVNSPPPPTISPERAARTIVTNLHHPSRASQTAWSNHAVIGAFRIAPAVWDRAVGPAFRLLSRGESKRSQGQ